MMVSFRLELWGTLSYSTEVEVGEEADEAGKVAGRRRSWRTLYGSYKELVVLS